MGNALPAVNEAADVATTAARGADVAELIDTWLDREDELLAASIARHSIYVGRTVDGGHEIVLRPDGGSVLITGTSGGGKSTLATAILERLAAGKFQLCVFDPGGDYGNFTEAVTFGDANTAITGDAVLDGRAAAATT